MLLGVAGIEGQGHRAEEGILSFAKDLGLGPVGAG